MRRLALLALLLAPLLLPSMAQAAYSGPTERLTVYNWNGTSASSIARWEQAIVWQSAQLQQHWQTARVSFVLHGGFPVYLVPWRYLGSNGDTGYHGQRGGQPYIVASDLGGSLVFSH